MVRVSCLTSQLLLTVPPDAGRASCREGPSFTFLRGYPDGAARPRSPLVAARIKREKWLYADFHLKCLKCLSLPSLPSSSSVAAAELSPTKRRPSSAVWALSSLDKERASERHFARGKILSGVFKGPEIRLLLPSHRDQSDTHTARVCFTPCRALPCVFPRLVLTREYGLLHPTRSFSSLEILQTATCLQG